MANIVSMHRNKPNITYLIGKFGVIISPSTMELTIQYKCAFVFHMEGF